MTAVTSLATQKKAATMGPAEVDKPDPKNFMKKYEKTAPLSKTTKTEKIHQPVKPAIPSKDEVPTMGQVTNKDFVKDNVTDAAHTAPKRVEQQEVDYLAKDEYGKIPNYLKGIKLVIQEEKDAQQAALAKSKNNNQFRLLTQDEKDEMIKGLKENWEKVNNAYRQLPITLNTLAQKTRKEQYEKQLKTIESDLDKLSKKLVYVHNDNL